MNQTIRQRHAVHEFNTRREMRMGDRADWTFPAKCAPRTPNFDGTQAALVLFLLVVNLAAIGWLAVEVVKMVRGGGL